MQNLLTNLHLSLRVSQQKTQLNCGCCDHIGPLVKDISPDSKIAKGYSMWTNKTACILDRAIKPDM